MLACLLVFYRSGAAVRTALPAAAGLALTLATLGFMHEPVNLFHVLSLLLVLGLGVDYAIILREGRSQQAVLAVFLSMTTTLISFGLLGFSSVPFVRSIGITVAFGVAFTFLIARGREAARCQVDGPARAVRRRARARRWRRSWSTPGAGRRLRLLVAPRRCAATRFDRRSAPPAGRRERRAAPRR